MISLLVLATLTAAPTISVEFHGTLRDALREVAHKGGLNLVATGELDSNAEVVLKDVSAEEALTSIAAAYELQVKHEGKLWVVKPKGEAAAVAPMPPMKPLAPLPPVPALAPAATPDQGQTEAAGARARARREQQVH